jgi:endonuclease-3
LRDEFDCKLPDNMDDLLKLPGVGRKTANLILGDVFGKPAVVTDTHAIRISNRLGLTSSNNPIIVERDLLKILPPKKSSKFCHRLVNFGRDICKAQNPKCGICELRDYCIVKKDV